MCGAEEYRLGDRNNAFAHGVLEALRGRGQCKEALSAAAWHDRPRKGIPAQSCSTAERGVRMISSHVDGKYQNVQKKKKKKKTRPTEPWNSLEGYVKTRSQHLNG